jgi:hypothetical protein
MPEMGSVMIPTSMTCPYNLSVVLRPKRISCLERKGIRERVMRLRLARSGRAKEGRMRCPSSKDRPLDVKVDVAVVSLGSRLTSIYRLPPSRKGAEPRQVGYC